MTQQQNKSKYYYCNQCIRFKELDNEDLDSNTEPRCREHGCVLIQYA